MNERINLLSEQAEEYADEWFKGEPTWSEAFESKFAKLIIMECCQKLENDGMVEIAIELKQHFGIEE